MRPCRKQGRPAPASGTAPAQPRRASLERAGRRATARSEGVGGARARAGACPPALDLAGVKLGDPARAGHSRVRVTGTGTGTGTGERDGGGRGRGTEEAVV
ncbi:hypothetical protein GCM10010499_52540 [Streptomyces thermoviolaceus subsp. apingens]|nr:hypothetical protein GCM10010499_52540 [Streptomyces thermoviolaceus subsp. apingens]